MITETTTVAELRQMPPSEVAKALFPDAEPAISRRYGPFGGLWFRPMNFPQIGSVIKGHKHKYDHVTDVKSGAVLLRYTLPDGETGERVYRAPAKVCIRRDVIHEFTALEADTFAECVYALRDLETGEVVDHWDGGLEAYR